MRARVPGVFGVKLELLPAGWALLCYDAMSSGSG